MSDNVSGSLPKFFRADSLLIKAILLGGLTVLLLVPLHWVHSVVAERADLSSQVERELGLTWGAAQRMAGPILVIPFRWQTINRVPNHRSGPDEPDFLERVVDKDALLYVLPESQDMTAGIETQTRKRGIYEALLYSADIAIEGHFSLPTLDTLDLPPGTKVEWDQAKLLVHLSDLRGSTRGSALTWGDETLPFTVAEQAPSDGSWIEAKLPALAEDARDLTYRFSLGLNGSGSLALVPLGRTSRAALAMDWPHPGFGGSYLPTTSDIDKDGVEARWSLSHLARDLPPVLRSDFGGDGRLRLYIEQRSFETRLVNPVDFYRKAERAVKYGLLFVVLTFATLLTFEVTASGESEGSAGRRLHLVQYGLVALALVLFFLLFLSLAEVLGFTPAFWLATCLSLGLISLYTAKVSSSARRGLTLGGALLGIYSYLYFTLRSEDHALLMGSLLLFALLAAMMFATRNVDWFKLGRQPAEEATAES